MVNVIFIVFIIGIFVLVALNGLIAGLTLGLLSLDETKLAVLIKSGDPTQQRAACRIQPLRKNAHLLLATLLLGSTVINEMLPILLQNVVKNEWISVLISVGLVLTFAELIPQAVCTHYGLRIGSMFVWFVYILRFLFFPVAYPIAKLLDFFLGKHEGALYKKAELKEFVVLHGQNHGGDLSADEVKIVQGTLSLHTKTVMQVMTNLEHVFMLNADTLLDDAVLTRIADSGHSRIPVYVNIKNNIIGILLVKNLILLDDSVTTYVRDLDLNMAKKMRIDTSLFDAINYFQEGASHMAIIVDNEDHVVGIATLEDALEELISEEIVDESDIFYDNTHTARVVRRAKTGSQLVQIIKPLSQPQQQTVIFAPDHV